LEMINVETLLELLFEEIKSIDKEIPRLAN
jgi:hypothetical protein